MIAALKVFAIVMLSIAAVAVVFIIIGHILEKRDEQDGTGPNTRL